MSRKRISRARKRDLEQPDEFLTLTAKLLAKLNQNRKALTIVVGALLLILMAFTAVRYFDLKAEGKALTQLSREMSIYTQAAQQSSPQKALETVSPGFEQLLANHENRLGGQLARLYWADLNFDAGRNAEAIEAFERAQKDFKPGDFAFGAALYGLGYAYAAADQNEQALGCFKTLSEGPYPALRADALFQMTQLYALMGEKEQAKALRQRLLEENPGYLYADLIRETDGQ
jgi:tetratricopeptide (TPR) repeat protein